MEVQSIVAPLVLRIDKFGRITLPKDVRRKLNSDVVSMEWKDDSLCLQRVPNWHELIGCLPGLDMAEFMREHHEERI